VITVDGRCARCGRARWFLTPAGGYACATETGMRVAVPGGRTYTGPLHLPRLTMVLTPEQLDFVMARAVAQEQAEEARNRANPDRRQAAGDTRGAYELQVQQTYVGLAGELAVAAAYGIPWKGEHDRFKTAPDVGAWDVRTRTRADYDLLIRPDDPARVVLLVLAHRLPFLDLAGWTDVTAARRHPEWLRTFGEGKDACYAVPQAALRPLHDLFGVTPHSARRDPVNTQRGKDLAAPPKRRKKDVVVPPELDAWAARQREKELVHA
jgi:hypothetical protein